MLTLDAFDPANDPHAAEKKLYEKSVSARADDVTELESKYPRIYNDVISTWSRESAELVQEDADFAAAEAARCPVLLFPIWRKRDRQPQSCVIIDADTQGRCSGLLQGNKTLVQRKKDFDDAVDTLVPSGLTRPGHAQLTPRFIASLDPNRYARWKVDLEKNIKAGLDVMPKTLPDAYSRAFTLKKVGQTTLPIADASVFVANSNHRAQAKKGPKGKG